MAKEKTARKVEIWAVTAPFTFNRVDYVEGDEFALPPDYELDEEQTRLNTGRPTFKRTEVKGTAEKRWELVTYEILPVTRVAEGNHA